jgi:hypothetical protein
MIAAVSGTVSDEAGEPVVGVEIRVFERRYLAGRKRLVAGGTQFTDDRGVYRLGTLPPGDYIVAFVSREVTMPTGVAEILTRTGPANPRFQELSRERMAMTGMSIGVPSGCFLGPLDGANLFRSMGANACPRH